LNEPHQHVVFIIAMTVAAIAGWLDWRKGEIPNWLTLGAAIVAPILHIARFSMAHEPIEAALKEGAVSLGGAALCAIVPLLLYRQSAIGGGDVKLFIVLGALLQPMVGVEAQMYGFFCGHGPSTSPTRVRREAVRYAEERTRHPLQFLPSGEQTTDGRRDGSLLVSLRPRHRNRCRAGLLSALVVTEVP
jgi:prepilin signal peptidase PulO-like enzyme (type II secretory pathway)